MAVPIQHAACFRVKDLQDLLLLERPAVARKMLWTLSPIEYLARRRGQAHMLVDDLPVATCISHIPHLMEYCRNLIDSASTPATAQEAATKASAFTARLIDVLSIPSVQNRLGEVQELQPCLNLLQQSLPVFQQTAVQKQQTSQPSSASPPGQGQSQQAAAAAAGMPLPLAAGGAGIGRAAAESGSPFASCPSAAAAAVAAAGQHPSDAAAALGLPGAAAGSSGMHLAALLTAIAPFTGQPGTLLPTDFCALITQWGRLVYGDCSDQRSIQVSALMLYHWRTLLRFMRLCLQGVATLSGTSGSGSSRPMPVSQAADHVQGLLHLLHHEALRALFTQQQYRRMTDRLVAMKSLLQGLPQTQDGCAAEVGSFCSASVAALMQVSTLQLPPVPPPRPAPAQPSIGQSLGGNQKQVPSTLQAPVPGSAHSSELSASQQHLLSVVKGQLQKAGALSPQHLDAVQEVLNVLRRQIIGRAGSDQFEVRTLAQSPLSDSNELIALWECLPELCCMSAERCSHVYTDKPVSD